LKCIRFEKQKVTLIRLIILASVSDYKNIKLTLHSMTENFGNIITLDEACVTLMTMSFLRSVNPLINLVAFI